MAITGWCNTQVATTGRRLIGRRCLPSTATLQLLSSPQQCGKGGSAAQRKLWRRRSRHPPWLRLTLDHTTSFVSSHKTLTSLSRCWVDELPRKKILWQINTFPRCLCTAENLSDLLGSLLSSYENLAMSWEKIDLIRFLGSSVRILNSINS